MKEISKRAEALLNAERPMQIGGLWVGNEQGQIALSAQVFMPKGNQVKDAQTRLSLSEAIALRNMLDFEIKKAKK